MAQMSIGIYYIYVCSDKATFQLDQKLVEFKNR